MTLTIQSYMTKVPWSIEADETISTAKARMKELGIRHLPVLEGKRLVGVISSRDLFLLESLNERMLHLLKVADLMTEEPYAVPPQALIADVATHMAERRIGSAMVVEDDRVVGVFTTVDALRALADLTRG